MSQALVRRISPKATVLPSGVSNLEGRGKARPHAGSSSKCKPAMAIAEPALFANDHCRDHKCAKQYSHRSDSTSHHDCTPAGAVLSKVAKRAPWTGILAAP